MAPRLISRLINSVDDDTEASPPASFSPKKSSSTTRSIKTGAILASSSITISASPSTTGAAQAIQDTMQTASVAQHSPSNRFDKYKRELQKNLIEEYETSHDRDSKAILVKKHKLNQTLSGKEDIYQGLNYYKSFLSKEDTAAGNATSQKYKYHIMIIPRAGPMRLSSTNRISCRFDFRPDVCKDYKETGSCGFGDSCIYVHDRGDYKHGWQLEDEWPPSNSRSNEEDKPSPPVSQNKNEDNICPLCNLKLKTPVETR